MPVEIKYDPYVPPSETPNDVPGNPYDRKEPYPSSGNVGVSPIAEAKSFTPAVPVSAGVYLKTILFTCLWIAVFVFSAMVNPLLMVAAYLGTVIFAAISANSLQFYRFSLSGVNRGIIALICCFFLWIVAFPWFLFNRYKVKGNMAVPKHPMQGMPVSTILLLVITGMGFLFVPIIAAIAIPNLLASRIMANEAMAIHSLKSYGTAQNTFKTLKLGEIAGNNKNTSGQYCDNFRNLHYGKDTKNNPIVLINKVFADAFAGPSTGAEANGDAPSSAEPYSGYVFLEDPFIAKNGLAGKTFALVAYPAKPGATGRNIYWIGEEGIVMMRPCKTDSGSYLTAIDSDDSPLSPNGALDWFVS